MAVLTKNIMDTPLGKELSKVIPPECRRIIIDIMYDGCIKLYYESFAATELLHLNWTNALANAQVISTGKKEK